MRKYKELKEELEDIKRIISDYGYRVVDLERKIGIPMKRYRCELCDAEGNLEEMIKNHYHYPPYVYYFRRIE